MLDVVDRVPGQAVHVLVIPDLRIELHQAIRTTLAIDEEVLVLILLQVTLIDVDGQDDCTGCDYRRAVLQELGVIALKLADLERHVVNRFVEVVVEDSQVSLHGLDGAGEVEVEAKHD